MGKNFMDASATRSKPCIGAEAGTGGFCSALDFFAGSARELIENPSQERFTTPVAGVQEGRENETEHPER